MKLIIMSTVINCKGLDRNMNKCKKKVENGENFCVLHDYMKEYTTEMMEKLEICSGCRKCRYLPFGGTCNVCKERQAKRKEDNNKNAIKCKSCNNTAKNEGYCLKHQTILFKEKTESEGYNVCKNYDRGCREKLAKDYNYKKCRKCLDKDNAKEREKRNEIVQINSIISSPNIIQAANDAIIPKIQLKLKTDKPVEIETNEESTIIKPIIDKPAEIETNKESSIIKPKIQLKKQFTEAKGKYCTGCLQFRNNEDFIGSRGQITKTCGSVCRKSGEKADAKRGYRERDYSGYENRQEVKEMRKRWRENHPEQTSQYWMNYRKRQINEDYEGYLKRNAENMKKYRKNNPEKFMKINVNDKLNPERKYYTYKRSAEKRGISWNLTIEQCTEFFNSECFYCGDDPAESSLNGIDRLDNDNDYDMANCVPCCGMCNKLKRCLDPLVLIDMCEHILTYIGKINGNLHDDIFPNHMAQEYNRSKYARYQERANRKKLAFDLNEKEFDDISKMECYLCGKKTTVNHKNGIDRFDNEVGYTKENSKSCCTNCNFLKSNHMYDTFINQLVKIYENNQLAKEIEENYNIVDVSNSIASVINQELNTSQINADNTISTIELIDQRFNLGQINAATTISETSAIELINPESNSSQINANNITAMINPESNSSQINVTNTTSENNISLSNLYNQAEAEAQAIKLAKRAEYMKNYRIRNGITKNTKKMTKEEKQEKARLRKEKSRQEALNKYGKL